jgi:hypothetical protein
MSQWGTYYWDLQGKTWVWMVNHYYNANGGSDGPSSGDRTAYMTSPLQITSASPSPNSVSPGQTFTITINANNYAGLSHTQIIIGASLYSSSTGYISDPSHDSKITLDTGSNNVNRYFTVPSSTPAGTYDLVVALWLDVDENNQITTTDLLMDLKTYYATVTVLGSETVSTPSTPTGPTSGTTGTSYTYTTGGSVSNQGHSLQYLIDWGDGTNSNWLPVGTTNASKSWPSAGTYCVKAKARCATHTSVESGWSGCLYVTIYPPRTLTVNSSNPSSGVSITVSPNDNNGQGSGTTPFTRIYNNGTSVTLTAPSTAGGNTFSSWTGCNSTSGTTCYVTMDANKTVTANYSTAGVLSVSPSDGLSSSGNQGGPFTPSSKTYTLQNTGGSSINWTASKGQAWVSLSSTSGTLGAGASTTVTVSMNSNANSLTPGTYSDTVTFTNTTNGNGNTTRPVSLTVNPTAGVLLSEAVDNTSLTWTTGGDANWYGQNTVYYYGGDAAQSGDITDNQSSWIQTTVTGPGTLTFYWKVSSESGWDFLRFYIDGVEQMGISGEVDWTQKTYSISSGSHTLKWAYTKDVSISMGSDAGWLDYVVFNPATVTYTLTATGDFNGDGITDIITRDPGSGAEILRISKLNAGNWSGWQNYWSPWPATQTEVYVGDFNGDGKDDILTRDPSTGGAVLRQSTGTGWVNYWAAWPANYSEVYIGDFNGDSKADILTRDPSTGYAVIRLSNTTGGNWSGWQNYWSPWPATQTEVYIGDFNGDEKDDILTRDPLTGGAVLRQSTGTGWVNYWAAWPVNYTEVYVGDFNGDGRADILTRNPSTGAAVLRQSVVTGGNWSGWSAVWAAWPINYTEVYVGDFNGDSKADILTRDPSTGNAIIRQSKTTGGSWTGWQLYWATWPVTYPDVYTGRFNSGTSTDILTVNPSGGAVVRQSIVSGGNWSGWLNVWAGW